MNNNYTNNHNDNNMESKKDNNIIKQYKSKDNEQCKGIINKNMSECKGEMSMVYFRLDSKEKELICIENIRKMRVDIDNQKISIKFDKEYQDYYYNNQATLIKDWNRLVDGIWNVEDIVEGEMEPITFKEPWMRR